MPPHLVAREGGNRQPQLVGELADAVDALLRLAALEGAVAMEGDGGQPVLAARMRFSAMLLIVVASQITPEPCIGLDLARRLMKMVQRFVGFLHGAKRSLDLAFGMGCHTGPV